MKTGHLSKSEDLAGPTLGNYLCGQKKVLPLPHHTDDWKMCETCEVERERIQTETPDAKFGLGISFAKR